MNAVFSCFNLVSESPVFRASLKLIEKYANNTATVYIHGETGTGKELAARAIHYLGRKRERPLVPANCGAIPDTLIEDEFFGHKRGVLGWTCRNQSLFIRRKVVMKSSWLN